ncbi:glycoside hydrolase family 3 protein [Alishewanella jeotgali]|uniref:beta-N-acetylhexosaminidase n=1 Tax=Alishewanella jeotgali KCTC 22429 TaxID=1129374 RepID=H3ZFM9_9ALTE|nr:glycoside hydrolase family 3 protein [Alishewanella jeotgali]EHR40641.1 beta-hexosaminidase A [Alishewanella jeotgali KCTC 22429]
MAVVSKAGLGKWLGSVMMICSLGASSLTEAAAKQKTPPVRQMLGQKLMLDLRYYCEQPVAPGACRTPLTQLPPALAELITQHHIGGVILFAENLQDPEQIVKLNLELQQAAAKAGVLPLFIGIDQEGGRVARLPRQQSTSFSGNMAIGATFAQHGNRFATEVGQILATELLSLGINVNFAPTVDVNVNPQNPVINVRSFGEEPHKVAVLGSAMTKAMQQKGLLVSLKHFPGHGDTHVDSHLGLPRVDHSKEQIARVDLLPFAQIIKEAAPAMIMTAHIQFPALDSSTFSSKNGEQMVKPATLSRSILTGVLREQLNYQGLIVTDALDMAGISHFFTVPQAVIETFAAGADIALMPVKLQSPAELANLAALLDELEAAVQSGKLSQRELYASYQRIVAAKQPLQSQARPDARLARTVLANPLHRASELALARAAVTVVKGESSLPLNLTNKTTVLLMPDLSKGTLLKNYLKQLAPNAGNIELISLQRLNLDQAKQQIAAADQVIAGFISPMQSLAEIGGMDDLSGIRNLGEAYQQQQQYFLQLLQYGAALKKPQTFVSLRSPYEISLYAPYAERTLATYAYHGWQDEKGNWVSPVYQALAEVLLGQSKATGRLPVTLVTQPEN